MYHQPRSPFTPPEWTIANTGHARHRRQTDPSTGRPAPGAAICGKPRPATWAIRWQQVTPAEAEHLPACTVCEQRAAAWRRRHLAREGDNGQA